MGEKSKKILVVDDNDDAADTLAAVLDALGYRVEVAHDGPSALNKAEAFVPDIALVDVGLPVMDGYELARRLRTVQGLPPKLRLVAVTGYGQESDRQRSREAGFEAHLVKPVDIAALARVVQDAS
jgi:CheY-like chemotaxis protein